MALQRAAPVKTFFVRALGVKTDERAWRIGADAEKEVAARLRKLGDRWKVLHAVPVGENGSDIDHVVVGRGGVFTINTKHHPDGSIWVGGNTFMVDGHRVPYVRNNRFEARRTAKFLTNGLGGLPVIATGVIAVMGARKGFTLKSQPPDGDVVVITRREVAKWLAERPAGSAMSRSRRSMPSPAARTPGGDRLTTRRGHPARAWTVPSVGRARLACSIQRRRLPACTSILIIVVGVGDPPFEARSPRLRGVSSAA